MSHRVLEAIDRCLASELDNIQDVHFLQGVSGGRDSMVMLDAMRTLGYRIQVGHVNYRLRGEASDMDEELVQAYCTGHNIPIHIHRISDQEVIILKQGNLQAKARDIRYRWLRDMAQEHKIQWICIAHHEDDRAETFLRHALRSSGMKGLSAMVQQASTILRPLLYTTVEEIEDYRLQYDVPFRKDQSNDSDEYDRNYIRHHILTPLKNRWPNAVSRINRTCDLLSDENAALNFLIEMYKSDHIAHGKNGTIFLPTFESIKNLPGATTLLLRLFEQQGLSPGMAKELLLPKYRNGAGLSTHSHVFAIKQGGLHISPLTDPSPFTTIEINAPGMTPLGRSAYLHITLQSDLILDTTQYSELIPFHAAIFPMTIRSWEQGDTFCPLGMSGQSQLVSDYMINNKLTQEEKDALLLLINGNGDIIWLINRRLDHRYRIEDQSVRNFMNLHYLAG